MIETRLLLKSQWQWTRTASGAKSNKGNHEHAENNQFFVMVDTHRMKDEHLGSWQVSL